MIEADKEFVWEHELICNYFVVFIIAKYTDFNC